MVLLRLVFFNRILFTFTQLHLRWKFTFTSLHWATHHRYLFLSVVYFYLEFLLDSAVFLWRLSNRQPQQAQQHRGMNRGEAPPSPPQPHITHLFMMTTVEKMADDNTLASPSKAHVHPSIQSVCLSNNDGNLKLQTWYIKSKTACDAN